MKVTRRTAQAAGTAAKPERKVTQRQKQRVPTTGFDGKKAPHARTLDPQTATHTPVPQRNVHRGDDVRADLCARIEAGELKRIDGPPRGLDTKTGVDVDASGNFPGNVLTQRTAFEQLGKVFVQATVYETPEKVWFEVRKRTPEKPDPAIALRGRVDASTLVELSKPPEGVTGNGVWVGPGGKYRGQNITGRMAFEVGDKLFIRATIWEMPGNVWYLARANDPA